MKFQNLLKKNRKTSLPDDGSVSIREDNESVSEITESLGPRLNQDLGTRSSFFNDITIPSKSKFQASSYDVAWAEPSVGSKNDAALLQINSTVTRPPREYENIKANPMDLDKVKYLRSYDDGIIAELGPDILGREVRKIIQDDGEYDEFSDTSSLFSDRSYEAVIVPNDSDEEEEEEELQLNKMIDETKAEKIHSKSMIALDAVLHGG